MYMVKRLLLYFFGLINKVLAFFWFQLEYYPQGTNNIEKINHFLTMLTPESQIKDLIRIGSDYDGGYLVPNDLDGIKYCYSPGVSDNSDFEDQLTTYGIECFLADYSVDKPVKDNSLFNFTKKYLGNKNDDQTTRLESWINDNKSDDEMLLQMDIEGAEYQIILDTPYDTIIKFRILVIEFHGFQRLAQQHSFDLITTSFYKLLRDFRIVHVHANNCCKSVKVGDQLLPPVMEFTFLRNDRFIESDKKISLPHMLDSKNLPKNKEINLPSLLG